MANAQSFEAGFVSSSEELPECSVDCVGEFGGDSLSDMATKDSITELSESEQKLLSIVRSVVLSAVELVWSNGRFICKHAAPDTSANLNRQISSQTVLFVLVLVYF